LRDDRLSFSAPHNLINNKLHYYCSRWRNCYFNYKIFSRARKQLRKNENTFLRFTVPFQSAKRLSSFSLRVLYFVLIILHPVCKCKMECANWKRKSKRKLFNESQRNFSPTIIPTLQNVKLSIVRRDFLNFLATAFCDAKSVSVFGWLFKIC